MLWSIIPLFLATSITNETAWPQGPEYIYKSKLTANYVLMTNQTVRHFVDLTNLVSCRPKSQDTLSCQYEPKQILLDGIENTSNETQNLPVHFVKFEIKFDRSGIKSYVTLNNLDSHELMKVKIMMNELNVGVDFITKTALTFQDMEKSLMGECMTDFTVTNSTHVVTESETKKEKLELVSVLNKNVPEDISVRKCRELNDCSYFRPSILAHLVFKGVTPETPINVQQFCSVMNITDNFETNTHVEGTFMDTENSYSFVEDYSLTLLDIRPASAKPVHYDDTHVTSLYAISKDNKKSDTERIDKNVETVINYTTKATSEDKKIDDTNVTSETTEEYKKVEVGDITSGENYTTDASTTVGTDLPTTVDNIVTEPPLTSVVTPVIQNATTAPSITVAPVVKNVSDVPTSTAAPVVKLFTNIKKTKHVAINTRAEMENEIVTEIIDCKKRRWTTAKPIH